MTSNHDSHLSINRHNPHITYYLTGTPLLPSHHLTPLLLLLVAVAVAVAVVVPRTRRLVHRPQQRGLPPLLRLLLLLAPASI
jgi:hypothetical protein